MNNLWLFPIALYALMTCSTCSFLDQTTIEKGDIYGHVIDVETGHPVPFAKVFLGVKENRTISADYKGKYSFENIEAGDYVLSAASDHYLTHFSNVSISENEPVEIDVKMEKLSQLSIRNEQLKL